MSRTVRRWVPPALLLLSVFALYAPALGVALFSDDAPNVFWLESRRAVDPFVFDANVGGAGARPFSNALWLLTRDLFGWFSPPIIHAWNIWLHVLNTALVYALARWFGRGGFGEKEGADATGSSSKTLFAFCAAALFAFFPFHYEPLIWAAGIYHLVMLAFGLGALLASLRGRWGIALLMAGGALLSHEGGFVFALVIAGVHAGSALVRRRRAPMPALMMAALGLGYALVFRFVVSPGRFAGDAPNALRIEDLWPNMLYFMQGVVPFASAGVRTMIGLTADWPVWIGGAFGLAVGVGVGLAARGRRGVVAVAALGVWGVMVAPAVFGLDRQYVARGPRLQYSASVAVAVFWSAALMGLAGGGRVRSATPGRVGKALGGVALGSVILLACVDGALGVREMLGESQAVSRTMFTVDRQLRTLPDNARVLYVNAPLWFGRASPEFLVGSEGMPIYQDDGTYASKWMGAQSNTLRETTFVRHELSLTRGDRWLYGTVGEVVDDAGLVLRMLDADLVQRWDYDAPGIRTRTVARLTRDAAPPVGYVARLAAPAGDVGDVRLLGATAERCEGRILLDVEWQVVQPPAAGTGVKVHGLTADGAQVLNADAAPLAGIVPISDLPGGLRVRETREIKLNPAMPAPQDLALGLYRGGDFAPFGEGVMIRVGPCRGSNE